MIDIVSWENAHLFGDAWIQHHRLRHEVFVERQGWDIPTYNGIEFDEYDTPAARYILTRDADGQVQGFMRFVPTTMPYMIKDHWPELVRGELPHTPEVWEATRMGVSPDLSPKERDRAIAELVIGGQEFGVEAGISSYIGVMPVLIFKRCIQRLGCPVSWLSDPVKLGNLRAIVGLVEVSSEIVAEVRRNTGILEPILNSHPALTREAA